MVDWTSSMQQTFEYYTVDPATWKDDKKLDNVKSCTISRDSEAETLGSATIDVTESVGECYIRIYLVTIQNGLTEKHPLGTFLVQTPSSSYDGKVRNVSMDAYTPLLELKENPPPLGYSVLKEGNIMDIAYRLTREHTRAPVAKTECSDTLFYDFVADTDDTWLSFLIDLIANAKYIFSLDELGRVLFSPKQDTASLQPVWTYDDSNSSILYPSMDMDHDLYGIPNVVEVIYSNGSDYYYSRVVNDDSNSPTSTVNRGREIIHRVTNPEFVGTPTSQTSVYYKVNYNVETGVYSRTNERLSSVEDAAEVQNTLTDSGDIVYIFTKNSDMTDGTTKSEIVYYCVVKESLQIREYAEQLLREMSTIEYTISYSHGYCPVRIGDCVRLNYTRAGLTDVKAKVISQSIKCEPGCPVSEKAVFTTKLWG